MGLSRIATWFKRPSRFRAKHFRRREAMRPAYQRLAQSLLSRIEFSSVADVGCANGFLLEEFVDNGKQIIGIELSPEVVEVLRPDVREVVSIGDFSAMEGSHELVCCVEVAEHIPAERADELLDNLVRHGNQVLFSAAVPGQGGAYHLNERPLDYWREKFASLGFRCFDPLRRRILE